MSKKYTSEDLRNVLYVNPNFYYILKKDENTVVLLNMLSHEVFVTSFPICVNGANGNLNEASERAIDSFCSIIDQKLFDYSHDDSTRTDNNLESLYQAFLLAYPEKANSIHRETCSICGGSFIKTKSIENKHVCCNCFNKYVTRCDKCRRFFFKTEGEVDRDGDSLCPICAKREYILSYHHNYPQVKFYGTSTAKNPQPFLGIELEVGSGGESDAEVKKILPIINKNFLFAYCSHDSSIDNGFEIITQPATLQYHNSIKHVYKQLFETLINDGYTSHDNMTCGFHVHFNRDFYSDNEKLYTTNLIYLVKKWWDNILKISRRNITRLGYCDKIYTSPNEYYEARNNRGSNHGIALNIGNKNTIEFRIFRGTLNVDTFMATLQFVNNCILAAKRSFEEVQNMKFEELITGRTLKNYWKLHENLGTEM